MDADTLAKYAKALAASETKGHPEPFCRVMTAVKAKESQPPATTPEQCPPKNSQQLR